MHNLSGTIDRFIPFGEGLPNVLIEDMHYDKTAKMLYVGTLGRGVWKMNLANEATPVLTINGTDGADTITLKRDSSSKLTVKVNNSTFTPVNIDLFDRVVINGLAGSDTLVIDNTAGFIGNFKKRSKFLGIQYNAGESSGDQDAITVLDTTVARERLYSSIEDPSNSEEGIVYIESNKSTRGLQVNFQQVELDVGTAIGNTDFLAMSSGLQNAADGLASLGDHNDSPMARSLLDMVNAVPPVHPTRRSRTFAPEGIAAHSGDLAFESAPTDAMPLLQRLFETGHNSFDLEEFGLDENGNLITDPNVLREALDELDDVPNNVTVTQQNGVTRFDVGIEKTLFGAIILDTQNTTGLVALNAMADLFADVKARVVFGIDSQGFFLDPNPTDANGNPVGPEITIQNIHGTAATEGRIGFVQATSLRCTHADGQADGDVGCHGAAERPGRRRNVWLFECIAAGGSRAECPGRQPDTPQDEDGNKGVQLTLTTTLDLLDPGTVTDQRVLLTDFTTNLTDVLDFGVTGALDIDGLKITASVGNSAALGELRISLEGEGTDPPGKIDELSDLTRRINPGQGQQGIQVTGSVGGALAGFNDFQNIRAEQVFLALQLIIEQLQQLGVGGVFDRPIPVINKSFSELVDLGAEWSQGVGTPNSANSVASAQQLQDYLDSRLGAGTVTVTVQQGKILFDVHFGRDVERFVPLSFSVGDSGIGIVGSGDLQLDVCADFNLRLGISTAAGDLPVGQRVFIDTSVANELSLRLIANAGYVAGQTGCGSGNADGALNYSATVGPVGLSIDNGRVLLDVSVGVDLNAANNTLTLGTLGSATLQPMVTGAFQAILPLDGDGGGVASNVANLGPRDARIEVAGRVNSLDNITVQIRSNPAVGSSNDLPHHQDPSQPLTSTELATLPMGTIRVATHHVAEMIQNSFLNFGTIITGLEQFIEWGQNFLGIDALDFKLPFIGKSLRDGLNFLESDRPGAQTLRTIVARDVMCFSSPAPIIACRLRMGPSRSTAAPMSTCSPRSATRTSCWMVTEQHWAVPRAVRCACKTFPAMKCG